MSETDLGVAIVGEALAAVPEFPAPPAGEEEPRRRLSPEHLAKMREGRRAAAARRRAQAKPGRRIRNPQPPRKAVTAEQSGQTARLDPGPAIVQPPFSFPKPNRMPTLEERTPRPVVLGEVRDVMERYWPLIVQRYPYARREYVRPQLTLATRGERHRLLRTENGLALFEVRMSPWEPYSVVVTIFAVGRDIGPLVEAGVGWARSIGAARIDLDQPMAGAAETVTWRLDMRSKAASA